MTEQFPFEQEKKILIKFGLQLVAENLVSRTWGNLSIRINEEQMLISPSGRSYQELTVNDIVLMGIILIGIIGFGIDVFMRWCERMLVPWKGRV